MCACPGARSSPFNALSHLGSGSGAAAALMQYLIGLGDLPISHLPSPSVPPSLPAHCAAGYPVRQRRGAAAAVAPSKKSQSYIPFKNPEELCLPACPPVPGWLTVWLARRPSIEM